MSPDDVREPVARTPIPIRAAETEASPEAMVGYIDRIEGRRVSGWAWNRARPDLSLEVEVRFDGRLITSVPANRFRQDLADGGIGDGKHAFEAILDEPVAAEDRHRVAALARNNSHGAAITLVNRTVDAAQPAAAPAPKAAAREDGPPPQLKRWLDDLAIVQRSFEEALKVAARDIRESVRGQPPAAGPAEGVDNEGMKELVAALAEIHSSQEALARQIEALEVYHARFDKALSTLERPTVEVAAEEEDAGESGEGRGLRLVVIAAAGVAALALLIGIWSVLF
jgi:hypothetical protein